MVRTMAEQAERDLMMEFHEKLLELRKRKGLTQEELAEALFISRAAVSKWESGRGYPNIDSLKAIAAFFSVTIDDILFGGEYLGVNMVLALGIPAVLSCYFDLFSGFVQAYVFTLLTMTYIAGSCPPPEEEAVQ